MKLINKGQVLAPDFISGVTLFATFLLGFALLWNFTLANQVSELDETESYLRSYHGSLDLIASSGHPSDWSSDDFSQLGLAQEPFKLSFDKLKELEDVPPLQLRSSLNAINLYIRVIEEDVESISLNSQSLERAEGEGFVTREKGVEIGYSDDVFNSQAISIFEFNDRNLILDRLGAAESTDYGNNDHNIEGLFSTGSLEFQDEEDTKDLTIESNNVVSFSYWRKEENDLKWDHVAGNFSDQEAILNGDEVVENNDTVDLISQGGGSTNIELGGDFNGKIDQLLIFGEQIDQSEAQNLYLDESKNSMLKYRHLEFERQRNLSQVDVNISKRPDQSLNFSISSSQDFESYQELDDGFNTFNPEMLSDEFSIEINGSTEELEDSWRIESIKLEFEESGRWKSFSYGVSPQNQSFRIPIDRDVIVDRPDEDSRAEVKYSIWR